ncbi:MAG: type II toxin-antitoxin system HicB family antitoxin [Isosphaerales bacterium]
MTRTLNVPLQIIAEVHEIEGGGYWAEVPRLPGCVAQAESIEALKENIAQAAEDWFNGSPVKTVAEARQLAKIQGSSKLIDESFPQPYGYLPPPS